jgi:hypothetical protein
MRATGCLGQRTLIRSAGEEDFLLDLRFRKCTFFLIRKSKHAGGRSKVPPVYCGTCFGIGMTLEGKDPTQDDHYGSLNYAVTAAHVIRNTLSSDELFIRVNTVGGHMLDIPAPVASWKFHPVTDVAVCRVEWGEGSHNLDAMVLPISKLPTAKSDVWGNFIEGEEVLIVGLLTSFPGTERIQPIVRSGRIALMPHEKIPVELERKGNDVRIERVDAYLIEMLSWPGLSGSPIIVYPHRNPVNSRAFDYMLPFLVLGLVHGEVESQKDVHFTREKTTIRLGSGVSVAIPGEDIYDVLMNNTELAIERAEFLEQAKNEIHAIATPHSNDEPAVFTEQDFEADLRRATRRVGTSEPDEEKK